VVPPEVDDVVEDVDDDELAPGGHDDLAGVTGFLGMVIFGTVIFGTVTLGTERIGGQGTTPVTTQQANAALAEKPPMIAVVVDARRFMVGSSYNLWRSRRQSAVVKPIQSTSRANCAKAPLVVVNGTKRVPGM